MATATDVISKSLSFCRDSAARSVKGYNQFQYNLEKDHIARVAPNAAKVGLLAPLDLQHHS
jgi:hypothetical protein